MTTVTQFTPNPFAPFQFQAVLDGSANNVIVTWNTYAQRWYINIIDNTNTSIVYLPLIGSPPDDTGISLVAGYFASTMVFRQVEQIFEVSP